MDFLTKDIGGWIWRNIVGPTIDNTFAFIPLWVWFIVGALAVGWAWKTFGWQGLVAVAIALISLGSYRQGWKHRAALDKSKDSVTEVEDDDPPIFSGSPAKPKPVPKPKAPVKPKPKPKPETKSSRVPRRH